MIYYYNESSGDILELEAVVAVPDGYMQINEAAYTVLVADRVAQAETRIAEAEQAAAAAAMLREGALQKVALAANLRAEEVQMLFG